MPLLIDGSETVPESTVIIEYLQTYYPGPAPRIPRDPRDPDAALQVRKLDHVADHYLMTPMQIIVGDHMRAPPERFVIALTGRQLLPVPNIVRTMAANCSS